MTSKTTVAVDQNLRKKIKKLSALLDVSQNVVIGQAIACLENQILSNQGNLSLPKNSKDQHTILNGSIGNMLYIGDKGDKNDQGIKGNKGDNVEEIDVSKILTNATEVMWNRDPERKELQMKLKKGPQTIDDFLFDQWITGLE